MPTYMDILTLSSSPSPLLPSLCIFFFLYTLPTTCLLMQIMGGAFLHTWRKGRKDGGQGTLDGGLWTGLYTHTPLRRFLFGWRWEDGGTWPQPQLILLPSAFPPSVLLICERALFETIQTLTVLMSRLLSLTS